MTHLVSVRRGSVYLTAATAASCFPGIEAVIILLDETYLRVLPVHRMAAGGCLLKIRNAAGDRVATAPDAFAARGLEDWSAEELPAEWSKEEGALLVPLSSESAN